MGHQCAVPWRCPRGSARAGGSWIVVAGLLFPKVHPLSASPAALIIISPLVPPAPLQHPVHRGVDGQFFVQFKRRGKSCLLAYANSLRFDNGSAQVTQTWGDGEISSRQYLIPLQGPSERGHLIPRLISFLCLKIPSEARAWAHSGTPPFSRQAGEQPDFSKNLTRGRGPSRCVHLSAVRMRAGCWVAHRMTWDVPVPRALRLPQAPSRTPACFWPSHLLL